jgi:CDP-glucose 4,6-dehydratase
VTILNHAYAGRRVFITGHTGFKGSWLCQWLLRLGAHIRGYALAPPTNPSLFNELQLSKCMDDVRGDIRDRKTLETEILSFKPQLIFHLAAQPLVRYSYTEPLETYETNVMGTIYLLDILRRVNHECAAIIVTSDKCYENREWYYGYRENDPMGGTDPYSSSKGMAELATSAYRKSFLKDRGINVASVRAGNVIGGGDWATDRIIPDCIRACQTKKPIEVRNPHATRPWQHVLDPLSGYLRLASKLLAFNQEISKQDRFDGGFNFGPLQDSNRTVQDVVTKLFEHIPGSWIDCSDSKSLPEARFLSLCVDKADKTLQWRPRWNFDESIRYTADWYRCYLEGGDTVALTNNQIDKFGDF